MFSLIRCQANHNFNVSGQQAFPFAMKRPRSSGPMPLRAGLTQAALSYGATVIAMLSAAAL